LETMTQLSEPTPDGIYTWRLRSKNGPPIDIARDAAMWQSNEERDTLLQRVRSGQEEDDRVWALLKLRDLAVGEHREDIWGDEECREALLAIAESKEEPERVSIILSSLLVNISSAIVNRRALLKDRRARKVVQDLFLDAEVQPEDARFRLGFAFQNLLLEASASEAFKRSEDLHATFLKAVQDEDLPSETKAGLFGALQSAIAAAAPETRPFWESTPLKEALYASLGPHEPEEQELRANVLGFIWALVRDDRRDDSMREEVWADEKVREFLLVAASPKEQIGVRLNALGALRSLAAASANQEAMWNEALCRRALREGAVAGQPADSRSAALRVLLELATQEANQVPMVSKGVHELLLAASEDLVFLVGERRRYRFGHDRLVDAWPEGEALPNGPFDTPPPEPEPEEGEEGEEGAEGAVDAAEDGLPSDAAPTGEAAGESAAAA